MGKQLSGGGTEIAGEGCTRGIPLQSEGGEYEKRSQERTMAEGDWGRSGSFQYSEKVSMS